jgi:putative oxidoreductase
MEVISQKLLAFIGRVCLSSIFILSGFHKIVYFEKLMGIMDKKGIPLVLLMLIGAIVFEIIGGVSVLLGWRTRIGALLLSVFILPTTFIFHDFWAVPESQQFLQFQMFLKNFAIFGGLLYVLAFGSGPKPKKPQEEQMQMQPQPEGLPPPSGPQIGSQT